MIILHIFHKSKLAKSQSDPFYDFKWYATVHRVLINTFEGKWKGIFEIKPDLGVFWSISLYNAYNPEIAVIQDFLQHSPKYHLECVSINL